MPAGIGGGGFMGLAFETTLNTYTAPTKFFPIRSESLKYVQDTQWRRPIRQNVDNLGGVAGNVHVEGDVEIEALEDVVPYFLYASRATTVKSGSTPNFVYTVTPNSNGVVASGRSLSLTVVRNGIVFGYTGCVVSSYKFSIDNGQLIMSNSILGSDEAVQSMPTPAYPTTAPFGAGQYNIQIPTATQVFDADGFEFNCNDNAEAQFRLKNTGRGAQFIKYGEREVTLTMDRDFIDRTEYDAFKALTAQTITLIATKSVNNSITWVLPVAVKDTYELGLSGQGDLIRASIAYQVTYDPATSKPFSIAVATQENIT